MKTWFPLLLVVAGWPAAAQFRYVPDRPQTGQPVSFTYVPAGTPLAADTVLSAQYVRYGAPNTLTKSQPVPLALTRQNGAFVGRIPPQNEPLSGVLLAFLTTKSPKRTDLNGGKLYAVPFADAGGQLRPHGLAGQASVLTRTNFIFGLGGRPDPNQVVQLYEQEIAQFPDNRPTYWADYVTALMSQKKPRYVATAKAAIQSYLSSRPKPTADELTTAGRLYAELGDPAAANAVREQIKTSDPKGALAQKDRAAALKAEPNWERRKALYATFVRDFPQSALLPMLGVLMIDGYYKANDIRGLLTFAQGQPPAHTDVLLLNTMAGQLTDERRSLPEAEELVRHALAVMNEPATLRPTDKASRQRQLTLTLARILDARGNDADAYVAYNQALTPEVIEITEPRIVERYYACALRTGHGSDARPLAEAAVETGRATGRMKATFRDWYARQPGQTPAKADAYIADLEADLKADQRDEMRRALLNEPAPAFTLTDLQGRTVSLAGLRGKIVVLDFWATWCGPCIASFPAMQQAEAKYKNDPNVRFLFVNTREGGSNPAGRARDFMARKHFDFVVPVDAQQRMADAYRVEGIPTKIIIDANGRVRYRYVGYNGSPETTVAELTTVIGLLKDK